jgi:hypothetical protein
MATKKWYPRTRTTLAGAGPATITTPLFDCIVVTPGGGVVSVVNLPSVNDAKIQDGEWVTFVNAGTGADMVLLVPNGAQTINGATFYRIFQKGSVSLQVNQTLGIWQSVHEVKGYPTTISISADNAGIDTNPGTASLPCRTIRKALELLDVQWTGASANAAVVNLGAAYSDGTGVGSNIAIPGPKPGSGGLFPKIKGPAQVDAGFGTITITGGAASTTSNFRTETFGAVAGLASNAGADFFFHGLSGSVNNLRFSVKRTTTTVVEPISVGSALTTGTFRIETPNASLDQTDPFAPGTGNILAIEDVDASCSATEIILISNYCRFAGNTFNNCLLYLGSGGFSGVAQSAVVIPDTSSMFVNHCTLNMGQVALRGTISLTGGDAEIDVVGADQSDGATSLIGMNQRSHVVMQIVKWASMQQSSLLANESSLTIVTGDLSGGIAGNSPIQIYHNSYGKFFAVTGDVGVAAGAAIDVENGSIVEVDAGTTVNAGGAANAVRVGANGVKSWATIAADVTVNVFDGGAINGGSGVSVRMTA